MSTPIPQYTTVEAAFRKTNSSVLRLIRFSAPDNNIHVLKVSSQPQELQVMRYLSRRVESQKYQRLFPVLRYYEEGRKSVIVMEHCEQGDLAYLVERRQISPSLELGRRLILQLTEALRELHFLGIAHCDIKPHNVFMTHNDFKLGDFGHAKFITEQNRESEFQNDAFMLGSTFLEFFSGQIGMEANRFTLPEMQNAIRRAIPDEFNTVITGLLMLRAEARYSVDEAFRHIPSAWTSVVGNREEEEDRKETEPVEDYPPIPMHPPAPMDPPPMNSGRHLFRCANPLTFHFDKLVAKLKVSLSVKETETGIINREAGELLRWLRANGGRVTVSVGTVEKFQCSDLKHTGFTINRVDLPCGCKSCRRCLNTRVLSSANAAGFTGTTQCVCGVTFDPLQQPVLGWLDSKVIEKVDSEILKQHVKCPKCTLPTDIKVRTVSQNMRCPCGHKFCTYCLKKQHKIFGCSLWKQEQVS